MKTKKNTVSARRLARSIEAAAKVLSRKFARMNEAQRLRAMQIVANIDDATAFDSIARNSFAVSTEL